MTLATICAHYGVLSAPPQVVSNYFGGRVAGRGTVYLTGPAIDFETSVI